VERAVDGQRAQALDVGPHLVEGVGDQLVAGDGLAHRAPLRRVVLRQAVGRLAEPDTLEAHTQPSVVHEQQHVLEALAALANQLGGRPVEG
jgi:hypothetical protein